MSYLLMHLSIWSNDFPVLVYNTNLINFRYDTGNKIIIAFEKKVRLSLMIYKKSIKIPQTLWPASE